MLNDTQKMMAIIDDVWVFLEKTDSDLVYNSQKVFYYFAKSLPVPAEQENDRKDVLGSVASASSADEARQLLDPIDTYFQELLHLYGIPDKDEKHLLELLDGLQSVIKALTPPPAKPVPNTQTTEEFFKEVQNMK